MPTPKKARTSAGADEPKPEVYVICNGLPGAMGREVSQACHKRGLKVAEFALTGPNMPADVDVEVSLAFITASRRFVFQGETS